MSPKLYHAVTRELEIGKRYSVDEFEGDSTKYYNHLVEELKKAESLIDNYRPQGTISRLKCIFFSASPGFCYAYAKKQYIGQEIHVYEVEVDNINGGYPMCQSNCYRFRKPTGGYKND